MSCVGMCSVQGSLGVGPLSILHPTPLDPFTYRWVKLHQPLIIIIIHQYNKNNFYVGNKATIALHIFEHKPQKIKFRSLNPENSPSVLCHTPKPPLNIVLALVISRT